MLFRAFIGRSLRKNAWRSLLTLLGVALGVAVMLSIHLANRASLSQFTDSLDRVAGKSNAVILPVASDLMDEGILNALQDLWGQGVNFTPVLEQTLLIQTPQTPHDTHSQNSKVVQLLGVDLFRDGEFRAFETEDQAQKASQARDTQALFQTPNVLVSQALAQQSGWRIGSRFQAQLGDREVSLRVAGILQPKGLGKAYEQRLLIADISVAQEVAHLSGRISRVDFMLPEGQASPRSALWQSIAQKLPAGVTLQSPKARGDQVSKMTRAFQQNLQALSFIALLVAMFLMYNTLSVAIIRRRTEIATLRAIGMARSQIFGLFLSESLLIGLLGNLLGVGLGVLFAHLSLQNVALTVQTLYTGQPTASLIIAWPDLILAFLLGLAMTLVATLQPLYEATTVSPALSLRPESLESRVTQASGKLALVGLGVGMLALICALQPARPDILPWVGSTPVFGFAAAFLTFFAAALMIPWGLNQILHALPTHWNLSFKLALAMMRGALGRTSVAIASLMIGIAMMVSLSVMIASFRQTVTAWVNQTLQADIFIEAEGRTVSKTLGGLSPQVLDRVRQDAGVADADGFYDVAFTYRDNPARLGAGNFSVLARHGDLTFLSGEPFKVVMNRVRRQPDRSVLVSEVFANKHGVTTGDWMSFSLGSQTLRRRVQGVYIDYASDAGYIVMDAPTFARFVPESRYSSIAVYLKPGIKSSVVRDRLQSVLMPQGYRLSMRTNDELRAEVMRIFDATFAVTYALHLIAMGIAMLSVLNTLFMLVVASRREFGILKYLGLRASEIRAIVLWQAVFLGVAGFLSGSVVGWLLSQLLIHVINKQSFGWTVMPLWPWAFWLQSAGLILITSFIAGVLPSRLATRTLPQEILRDA